MADEATINSVLSITKGLLQYTSKPAKFLADVAVGKGPSPGAITATRAGTVVDLSELALPGLCRVMNIDDDNDIIVGIGDGVEFYPLMDLKPGESFVFRISKWLSRSMNIAGTGTGTFDMTTYSMVVKGEYADCVCIVDAFDS